jgi:hypothetical protein
MALHRAMSLADAALTQPALLVKGAALCLGVYDSPTDRPMCDVDVIVAPGSLESTARALCDAGFRGSSTERALTQPDLELQLMAPTLAVPVLVELHVGLDKVVQRPIDYDAIFARSSTAPGFERLRVPALEDHLILVALHLAVSDFAHRAGFADLAMLITRGADVELAMCRAESWKVRSALELSLSLLDSLSPGLVSPRLLSGKRATRLRVRLARRVYSTAEPTSAPSLGLPWILRQTLLRDDLAHWALGLGVYGAKRVAERALTRWRRSPSSE